MRTDGEKGRVEKADLLDYLAWLMDQAVRIPGTNIRFGLDALIGLLPFGGEVLTAIVQSIIVFLALSKQQVPKSVAARMILNVALDSAIGAIPLIGDLFDVFFKANVRNVALLRRVQEELHRSGKASARPHVTYLVVIAATLLLILGTLVTGIIVIVRWLVG